jgi:rRNA maturation endonuclease Nob1
MSFIVYKLRCKECKHIFDTAFGVVGSKIIAVPAEKCPQCRSERLENLFQKKKSGNKKQK